MAKSDLVAKSKVGFCKTHKCASSSIQNILMRWGLEKELNFALPLEGNYFKSEDSIVYNRSMLSETAWEKAGLPYDIFCVHTVWNTEQVRQTLGGKPNLISIVRDPATVFLSMWEYYRASDELKMSLEDFIELEKPPRFGFGNRFGRNQTLFDLGFPWEREENEKETGKKEKEEKLNDFVDQIFQDFSLIMISERIDESRLLLGKLLAGVQPRHLGCLKLNGRNSKSKLHVSSATMEKLKTWLEADYILYQRANQELDKLLSSTEEMEKKELLAQIKEQDRELERRAVRHDEGAKLGGDFNMWSEQVEGYIPGEDSDTNVRLACTGELQFLDKLRAIQLGRLPPETSEA